MDILSAYGEIRRLFEPDFRIHALGADYLAYRLRYRRSLDWLTLLSDRPILRPLSGAMTFYLAGLVWVLDRK